MKKKIRLDADALEVLSFTTATRSETRGTVLGARTGYTCYETAGYDGQTRCLHYAPSYWGEDSCTCPPVLVTDPSVCDPVIDTADLTCATCMTCPGIHPGC